jgi:hypothetical protein
VALRRTGCGGGPEDIAMPDVSGHAKRPRWRSTDAGQSRPSSTQGCSPAAARRPGATAGGDTSDGVHNPCDTLTAAIDVYGGDFVTQPRSQWDPARPRSGRSISPQRVSNSPTRTLLGRLTMAPDVARLVRARRRALASDDQRTSQMVTGHSSVDIDHMVPAAMPSARAPSRSDTRQAAYFWRVIGS